MHARTRANTHTHTHTHMYAAQTDRQADRYKESLKDGRTHKNGVCVHAYIHRNECMHTFMHECEYWNTYPSHPPKSKCFSTRVIRVQKVPELPYEVPRRDPYIDTSSKTATNVHGKTVVHGGLR